MADYCPKGVNPRIFMDNFQERGPTKHVYTVHDIAALLGVTVRTVHNMKSRPGAKRVDITSLESICRAWARKHLNADV
jgi:hypothetical protein